MTGRVILLVNVVVKHLPVKNIRICHECEGGIEKSVPRVTNWHHQACRVMTNRDHEGRICLSHPHTNNGFFFLLTTKYHIYFRKTWTILPKIINTLRCYIVTSFSHNNDVTDLRAASVWPTCGCSFFYLSHGLVQVCEINRIHHWCSVGTVKSQPKGPPFQWETRLSHWT